MKWANLKSGCCPKCGEVLKQRGPMLHCMQPCTFKITETRLLEIVRGDDKPKSYNYRDNQAELSKLPNKFHGR